VITAQGLTRQGERRALLEERKRWEGDFLSAEVSPMVKPGPKAQPVPIVPTAEASSSSSANSAPQVSLAPPASPWKNHQPSSPSPLSPAHHKVRTPRPHLAGRRKAPKTPLARLVLEKAVRQREKEGSGSSVGNVFGTESTRRANVIPTAAEARDKGNSKVDLKASTRLGQSVGSGSKRDLSKSEGVGPKAAAVKAGKTWR
jgi:hypothetical protein